MNLKKNKNEFEYILSWDSTIISLKNELSAYHELIKKSNYKIKNPKTFVATQNSTLIFFFQKD